MLFAVGTKVKLKHTGDEGFITKILGDDMLEVFIAKQNMNIPVFEEDLIALEAYAKPTKPQRLIPTDFAPEPLVKYDTLNIKNQDLLLAFDPDYDDEGIVKKYQIFLINTTNYGYVFSCRLSLANKIVPIVHGKSEAISTFYLQDLLFDQLNEAPNISLEYWEVSTTGTGKKKQKIIKIKAQQFFKKVKIAPLLKRPAHLYSLLDHSQNSSKQQRESLKDYTKKKIPSVKVPTDYQLFEQHSVVEYASFINEIDLHIENLTNSFQRMNNGEKLRLQLKHFDAYMSKAIRLGVPRVFIIHGLGKGKLRNIIATKLMQMPEVKTFKNEYHHKYGWGATEVIF